MKKKIITFYCASSLFLTAFMAPLWANITGSMLTATTGYTAGETNTFVFRCDAVTPDFEYMYTVSINYLTGMDVLSGFLATGEVNGGTFSYTGSLGDAAIAQWDSDENLGAGYGSLVNGESAFFTNNVFVNAAMTGELVLSYTLTGDGYAAAPHTLTSTLTVIPEASTIGLFAIFGTGLFIARRRVKKNSAKDC